MGDVIVINIPKNFIVEEVGSFRMEMNKLLENGNKNFILDFSRCDYVDSTGLGAFVAVYKKCKENGGSIKLKSLNPTVEKIFKLTRLDRVFEIYT